MLLKMFMETIKWNAENKKALQQHVAYMWNFSTKSLKVAKLLPVLQISYVAVATNVANNIVVI